MRGRSQRSCVLTWPWHARWFPTVILWLGLLPSPSPAGAQPRFDSWTTENGLPQNSVNDILQTRDGYLWLATHGGLVRFDGMRFVVFDRSTPGVGSQRLRALHQDRKGALWAATEDGMLIRHQDGRFVTYSARDGVPQAAAVRIEEDDQGCLWVTWVDGITRFDGQRFVNFGANDFRKRLSVPPVARYHDAWWSQDTEGLHVFVSGAVRTFPNALIGSEIKRVHLDRRGSVWISTHTAGLIKASAGTVRRYTMRDGLPGASPEGPFAEGSGDDLWLVDRGSLYRVRDGRAELFNLPGAPFSGWRSFFVDQEGSTWLGTTATGLHRVVDPKITVHAEGDGVSLHGAYPILQDETGAIWVGNGGLVRYANGRWTSQWPPQAVAPGVVTSIYADRAHRLWVGTSHGGAGYFERGRYTALADEAGLLRGRITAMLEDRSGSFWFATGSGLVKLENGRLTRYTTSDGLSHDRITALFEDRGGVLWIGTFQGLTRLAAGRFAAWRARDGFIGNDVRALHQDDDGVLWVGTYDGGLYRLADERLTRFTRSDGLHDNGVFQILEDDAGYFWMGSNRGISRVGRGELNDVMEGRRRSVNAVAFGPADGLARVEVNGGAQPPGLAASDGTLWFPTMGGVAVLNPAAFGVRAPPPPAIIEELRLNGAPIDFSSGVTVPRGVRTFEIRFTAPSFVKPAQVRFRYRLAGLEEEWTDAGERRTVSFHTVPPGRYRFEVVAASHDGVWNTGGPSVAIVVVPPFWRTWWFMVLALAATLSAAVGAHERRIRRLRRLHAMQEGFSQRLIDSQERERRRVSSEMHDSLGQHMAVLKKKARAGLELAGNPAAAGAFAEIAALAETVNTEMKEIAYAVRPHHLDTIGLSKTIETMVTRVGRACDIQLTADIVPIDEHVPEASHIHVFRIVQEAVSNIVKHSGATRARVSVSHGPGSLVIAVEDNGRGFSSDDLDAARLAMHGAGLVGIRERVRILGGRLEIQSNGDTGTMLSVTLPLEDDTHG